MASALARGASASVVPARDFERLRGPNSLPVFYGILRGTGEIARARADAGLPFVYVDRGYVGTEHYGGYYRVVLSALHWAPSALPPARAEWQGRQALFSGWARERKLIVVARPPSASAAWHGFDPDAWVSEVCSALSTKRPVIITRKGDGYGMATLKQAHALITHSSNLAVDALAAGCPSVVLGQHPLAGLGNTELASIEQPYYAERGAVWALCQRMLSTQWTLREIASGRMWEWLAPLLAPKENALA